MDNANMNQNPSQQFGNYLREFFATYFKRGAGGGLVSGVIVGSACTQGAVLGGVLGAPFGGAGAIPGAAIGAMAGAVVGTIAMGAAGKAVDFAVSSEVAALTTRQLKQQEQIDMLIRTQQQSRDRERQREERIAQLADRLDDAISDIRKCPSTTHTLIYTAPHHIESALVCAITHQILKDPITVTWQDESRTVSKTYERAALIQWKQACEQENMPFADPLTRKIITIDPETHPTDTQRCTQVQGFLASNPEHYGDQHGENSGASSRLT